jgi:hypothetical protein
LAYFVEIEPVQSDQRRQACNWLLVVGDTRDELAAPSGNQLDQGLGRQPPRRPQGKIPPFSALTAGSRIVAMNRKRLLAGTVFRRARSSSSAR